MYSVTLLLWFYFFQFASSFHSAGGLFEFVFGYQRFCFCRCGITQQQLPGSDRTGRLLSGEVTSPNQFPWLALVNIGSQVIGGSLISERHVITAASPLYGITANHISVTLGAHNRCGFGDGSTLNNSVEAVFIHPGFVLQNKENDIALLKTRHVNAFSQFISPVCMPNYVTQKSEEIVWIASWMTDSSNSSCLPLVTTLPTVRSRACVNFADSYLVTSDKGCLGPLGSRSPICKADVGAPVMSRRTLGGAFTLVGVISTSSCNGHDPPLYTKVTAHAAWIHEHIRNYCQCF